MKLEDAQVISVASAALELGEACDMTANVESFKNNINKFDRHIQIGLPQN